MRKTQIILVIISLILAGAISYVLMHPRDFDYDAIYLDASALNIHYKDQVLTLINAQGQTIAFSTENKVAGDFLNNFYISGELLRPKASCLYFDIEINRKNVNNVNDLIRSLSCKNSLSLTKLKFSL